jgi:hypothetical protein
MRSLSTVTPRKTIAISSVVPSPQLTGRGGRLGWRRLRPGPAYIKGVDMVQWGGSDYSMGIGRAGEPYSPELRAWWSAACSKPPSR